MRKTLRTTFLQALRTSFLFLFIATWMFTAWPSLFSFPPKVPELSAASNWYSTSWNYRKLVTIPASSVSSTTGLLNFPVLINTTDRSWKYSGFGGNVGSATGWDFVITAADGVTKLNHEIETYAPSTGALIAWVQMPFLSPTSTNQLFIYYGNAAATDQSNKNGVWDSNYKGVYHLSNGTTLNLNDSTANGQTLTNHASVSAATGEIDGGAAFSGSNYLSATGMPTINPVTISGWFNLPVDESCTYCDGVQLGSQRSPDQFLTLGTYINRTLVQFGLQADAGTISGLSTANVWAYVVGVMDGSKNMTLYGNGVPLSTAVTANNLSGDGGLIINNAEFAASQDEVRVSNIVRSGGWIATEYKNQSSPSTFYGIASEQNQSNGVGVTNRSDILSNSTPSATSNHTFAFTVNSVIYGSSISGSSTLTLTLPSAFTIPAGMDCGDVDAATSSQFNFNWPACQATATAWGFSAASSVLTLTPPADSAVHVATSTPITIKIGTNATNQQQGIHWITNPSTGGTYTITLGGTSGNGGNFLVAVGGGQTVSAQVAETLAFTVLGVPNWYNSSWGYRKQIVIDHTKVSGTATSFPVLIESAYPEWKYTSFNGHVASATGADFVITANDGTTKLDHEIDTYASSTGALAAWVRVPFLSSTSNTILYAYYGNAAATNQQNPTGVWSNGYALVSHFTSTSTPTLSDSTANNHTLTNSGTVAVPGQIDGAVNYNGSANYLYVTDDAALRPASAITISAWINQSVANDFGAIFEKGYRTDGSWNNPWISYAFETDDGNSGLNKVCVTIAAAADCLDGNTVLGNNTWYYVTGTYDGSHLNIYLNGASDATPAAYSGNIDYNGGITSDPSAFARSRYSLGEYFNGSIDELRVSNVARSGGWTATEYNNQSSPGTFYTINFEQPQGQVACTADDGASVNVVNTSDTLVGFGTVSANTFYQGCQDLVVSTNAGGGYSLAGQESNPLMTSGGKTIPDTTCDNGPCTVVSGTPWVTATNNGFGHTCLDQKGHDCSNEYAEGTKFRPFGIGSINPVLTGIGDSSSSTKDLTSESPTDWIKWDNIFDPRIYRKAGVKTQISDYTLINIGSVGVYANDPRGLSWSDGTPTQSISNDTWGVYADSVVGAGFSFTVPASTQVGILTVHVGGYVSNATFTAHLSDGSAPDYVDNAAGAPSQYDRNYTITFAAGSPLATLTITWIMGSGFGGGGNVTLNGAALAGGTIGDAIMTSSTPSIATGRVKYRLSVPRGQAAGTYTNIVDYILIGTY